MKRLIRFTACVVFGIALASSQPRSIAANVEVSANLSLLEQWVRAQMSFRELPGMSVAIVFDQDLVYAKGFGYSNAEKKEPATPQTIYRIASLTKLFTATAVMKLRDAEKLRLDDPIDRHLPWLQIKNRFPDAPKVTIWNLLTHTSGLPREAAFPYWTDNNFPTRTELIKGLERQETIVPPGTKSKYSNLGMTLAGEIVTEVAGVPYSEYVMKNIVEPLGMTSTTVYFPDVQTPRLALGYSRKMDDGSRRLMPFTNAKALVASANMSSTVEDLARFASLQFRSRQIVFGDQILKGSTLREMHRIQWLDPEWTSGWGLGFSVWREEGRTAVGHSGWVAGYRSQLTILPDDKIAVIVMTNADDGDAGFFAEQILKMMVPSIKRATASPVEISIPDLAWAKYVGRYVDSRWFEREIMVMNGRLVMYEHGYPPEDNPRGNLTELTPAGPNIFRMTGENGNDEYLVFELGSKGEVERVKIGENYIYPTDKPR